MKTLEDIKAKARELEKERQSLTNQITAVDGQWQTQFLLAMALIYRVRKGSIVERHGKRYEVKEIDDFCQGEPERWGESPPWISGYIIKKDGSLSHQTRQLFGEWKLISE